MNTKKNKKKVLIRISYVGDSDSGKDQLREKCFKGESQQDRTNELGVDFSLIDYEFKNILIKFQIWALSVSEKHQIIREKYYAKTAAVILIFDVTKPDTFYNLPNWLEEIWKTAGKLPMVIIGNNKKLREKKKEKKCISFKLANLYAKRISEKIGFEVPYFETSTENCENIDDVLNFLAEILCEKHNLT
ncbi:MAG: hypothetical protein FK733_14745 [Asgard group archaeon]|nr:hypothetical protein [Asgard group archaeon]